MSLKVKHAYRMFIVDMALIRYQSIVLILLFYILSMPILMWVTKGLLSHLKPFKFVNKGINFYDYTLIFSSAVHKIPKHPSTLFSSGHPHSLRVCDACDTYKTEHIDYHKNETLIFLHLTFSRHFPFNFDMGIKPLSLTHSTSAFWSILMDKKVLVHFDQNKSESS